MQPPIRIDADRGVDNMARCAQQRLVGRQLQRTAAVESNGEKSEKFEDTEILKWTESRFNVSERGGSDGPRDAADAVKMGLK
jgi:hypothetical protein